MACLAPRRLARRACHGLDWRKRSHAFDALAIYNLWKLSIWGDPEPERIETAWVTATYFSMLSGEPALGRVFTAEEEIPGQNRVAVISHRCRVPRGSAV